MQVCSVMWFRRDLRLEDNHALAKALEHKLPVLPIFIFDSEILSRLPANDARVGFIHQRLSELKAELKLAGADLHVYFGRPLEIWRELFATRKISAVFCNEDYEPYAIARDLEVAKLCAANGAEFNGLKDQVIFAKNEICKDDGKPYRVFTPFSRRWKAALTAEHLTPFPSPGPQSNFLREVAGPMPTLGEIGFQASAIPIPSARIKKTTIEAYAKARDFMAVAGTTRLGLHLRFGTVSVRKLVAWVRGTSEVFLNELIWREFFMQILFHFPHTVNEPFDPRYKNIAWRNSPEEFKRWCTGYTGYPAVDAGMRELNATGFMHNRARMITASFLTKHLLIDWTWGERYFAERLLDFDLSANVGNWQWAAGSGCDASPYFRVFNPTLQAEKFDPKGEYQRKWLGDVTSADYPEPMVNHEMARRRAITVYKQALEIQNPTQGKAEQ